MRVAIIERNTKETQISLTLNLDDKSEVNIDTGCGFLDHMLTLFASHGKFGLSVNCKGDTEVDYHHSVEDIGICLGMAFEKALGDKKGIYRYGYMILPMDETLILSAVDLSGRAILSYNMKMPTERVGDFDTELVEEFFMSFVRNANCALHIRMLEGTNSHHVIEGTFKSFARSIKAAVAIEKDYENEIPSTKGVL